MSTPLVPQPVSPLPPGKLEDLLPWAQKEVIPLLRQLRAAVNGYLSDLNAQLLAEIARSTGMDAFFTAERIAILNSLNSEIGSSEHLINKGQPSGYVPLGTDSKIPATFLGDIVADTLTIAGVPYPAPFDYYGPFSEEFLGSTLVPSGAGGNVWFPWLMGLYTTGGTCVVVNDTTTYRSGVVGVTTGGFLWGSYQIVTDNIYDVQTRRFVFETVVRIPTLSTSSQRFTAAVGLNCPNIGTTSAHFCLYTADNVNSGRWLLAYALGDGSAEVTVDSTVAAVQAGHWYHCKFWWDGTKAYCSIDAYAMAGVALAPTATTAFRFAAAYILKTVGTTLRQIDVDKCTLVQTANDTRTVA